MNTRDLSKILPPEAEERLDDEIKSFVGGRDLELYKMMEYQMGWTDDRGAPDETSRDRRRHGELSLASAMACVGDFTPILKYAISVELIHNFSLIHGDVQDGNTERRGRGSVWWKWGPSQAINTGDGMHALARASLFRLHDEGEPAELVSRALEILDSATLQMCEGEYLDVAYQERPAITVDEFLDMSERRNGALFGAAAELGSIFSADADSNLERGEALRQFGINIGVVRQIVADFLALFGEGGRDPVQQGRIIAKKKTLPLAHFFESVSDATMRRRAGELYMQRVIDPSSIDQLVDMATDVGSREFTLSKLKELIGEREELLYRAGFAKETSLKLMALADDLSDIKLLPKA